MINRKFLVGTLVVMVLLTVVGCDDYSNNGNGGSGFLGGTLNLSGQVYLEGYNSGTGGSTYELFNGNRTVANAGFWAEGEYGDDYHNIGGSGFISNGLLNFTIGSPSTTVNILEYHWWWGRYFNNFNISTSNANIACIEVINVTGGGNAGDLCKDWYDNNAWEEVTYIYVNRDVSITGGGKTTTEDGYTRITRNLNLNLKTGWNAISIREEWSGSMTVSSGDSTRARWNLYEGD